jgi:hypothetical protein
MSNFRVEKRVRRFDHDQVRYIDIEYKLYEVDYSPHSILVSSNGYQWSGFALHNKDEVIGLRDALNEYIWQWGWE